MVLHRLTSASWILWGAKDKAAGVCNHNLVNLTQPKTVPTTSKLNNTEFIDLTSPADVERISM